MQLIVAIPQLSAPGGPQTYSLTVAEHLARLGHAVTLYTREIGAMAALARERCLNVVADLHELPERVDGVLVGVDRSLAFELAARYPEAVRVFLVHGSDDIHLPPPVDGVVTATVVFNDRLAARVAACVGAGEIVRLRQPIDMRRFPVGRQTAPHPQRALLLGNYHGAFGSRAQTIKDAWCGAGLRWEQVGYPHASLAVAEAMSEIDIVVGYGRSILEAMACERPAYVFDHAGGDGWVTPESYERIEAAGFSGLVQEPPPDAARLRADLDAYRPELGPLGRDLCRTYHDAREHAAQLVMLLARLRPEPAPVEDSVLRAFALLCEAQLRAEIARDHHRQEAKQWFDRAQALNAQLAVQTEQEAKRLDALRTSRRYRLAHTIAQPADVMRRVRGRSRPGGGH